MRTVAFGYGVTGGGGATLGPAARAVCVTPERTCSPTRAGSGVRGPRSRKGAAEGRFHVLGSGTFPGAARSPVSRPSWILETWLVPNRKPLRSGHVMKGKVSVGQMSSWASLEVSPRGSPDHEPRCPRSWRPHPPPPTGAASWPWIRAPCLQRGLQLINFRGWELGGGYKGHGRGGPTEPIGGRRLFSRQNHTRGGKQLCPAM